LAQAALGPLFRCGWLEPHRGLGWNDHWVLTLASTQIGRGEVRERGIGLSGFNACQIGEDWIVVEEGKKGVVVGGLRSVEVLVGMGERGKRTEILQMESNKRKRQQSECAFETILTLDNDQQIPHVF
jgi:hypothetical protein